MLEKQPMNEIIEAVENSKGSLPFCEKSLTKKQIQDIIS